MELFGHQVQVREYGCSFSGKEPTKLEKPRIALYTRFKGCNASCSFCEYMDDASYFDLKRYKEILLYLKERICINRINLTGGEPTLNWKLFKEVVDLIRSIFPDIYLVLNTNGYNLERLYEEKVNEKISNISLSRHHYDDKINQEIFKTQVPSTEIIRKLNEVSPEETFHVTCNLIKGYIDSKDEAIKFLEWASDLKLHTASFVSLMPINDYCKDNFIHFDNLDLNDKLHQTQAWKYENMCECFNWIYFPENDEGSMLRVYTKNTFNPMDIVTSLVYDGKNVRAGFSEKIIA